MSSVARAASWDAEMLDVKPLRTLPPTSAGASLSDTQGVGRTRRGSSSVLVRIREARMAGTPLTVPTGAKRHSKLAKRPSEVLVSSKKPSDIPISSPSAEPLLKRKRGSYYRICAVFITCCASLALIKGPHWWISVLMLWASLRKLWMLKTWR